MSIWKCVFIPIGSSTESEGPLNTRVPLKNDELPPVGCLSRWMRAEPKVSQMEMGCKCCWCWGAGAAEQRQKRLPEGLISDWWMCSQGRVCNYHHHLCKTFIIAIINPIFIFLRQQPADVRTRTPDDRLYLHSEARRSSISGSYSGTNGRPAAHPPSSRWCIWMLRLICIAEESRLRLSLRKTGATPTQTQTPASAAAKLSTVLKKKLQLLKLDDYKLAVFKSWGVFLRLFIITILV